jgi:hypothetical protein
VLLFSRSKKVRGAATSAISITHIPIYRADETKKLRSKKKGEVRHRAHLSYGVLKLGRINALVLLDLPSRGVHLPFFHRTLL